MSVTKFICDYMPVPKFICDYMSVTKFICDYMSVIESLEMISIDCAIMTLPHEKLLLDLAIE